MGNYFSFALHGRSTEVWKLEKIVLVFHAHCGLKYCDNDMYEKSTIGQYM